MSGDNIEPKNDLQMTEIEPKIYNVTSKKDGITWGNFCKQPNMKAYNQMDVINWQCFDKLFFLQVI